MITYDDFRNNSNQLLANWLENDHSAHALLCSLNLMYLLYLLNMTEAKIQNSKLECSTSGLIQNSHSYTS